MQYSNLPRPILAVGVVAAFVGLLYIGKPPEAIAALSPLATLIVQFYFRKSGPSGDKP